MDDRTYEKIRAALRDIDHSAMSWNGVNVFGDRKSIDAVVALTNIADRAKAMDVYIDESKKIAAARERQLAEATARVQRLEGWLRWFYERRAVIQAKFDLYGTSGLAHAMKTVFKGVGAALAAGDKP